MQLFHSFFSLPERFAKNKKYLSSFPQSLSDTDSCLNYKGSTESNEPTEISSYRVTPAAPLTLTSAFEPRQMSFSFTIPKSEWVMFAGTEVLWRSALHANVVLHPSSPTNQPFCSKLICIQYSGILPICTAWKYKFHSSPVRCSWNHLELSLNWSWIHAAMHIYAGFLWSKTYYYLMASALIWQMYNAQALNTKFSRDD